MKPSTTPKPRARGPGRRTAEKSTARWLLLVGAGIAAAIAVVLIVIALSTPGSDSPLAEGELDPGVAGRLAAGGHSTGPANATVTVLEFADFQCPYCRAFWAGPLQQLKREFLDTGRVRLVYRHAIVVGPESAVAAQASECAADQGQFFAYHDVLFGTQGPENSGYLTAARLSDFAGRIGLDVGAFDRCLAAGTHRAEVTRLSSEAHEAGIHSTPSVYVDGRKVENPFDYGQLRAAILAAAGGG